MIIHERGRERERERKVGGAERERGGSLWTLCSSICISISCMVEYKEIS